MSAPLLRLRSKKVRRHKSDFRLTVPRPFARKLSGDMRDAVFRALFGYLKLPSLGYHPCTLLGLAAGGTFVRKLSDEHSRLGVGTVQNIKSLAVLDLRECGVVSTQTAVSVVCEACRRDLHASTPIEEPSGS